MMENWDWPQWVFAVWLGLSTLVCFVEDGKPHKPYSAGWAGLSCAGLVWLTWAGGFWS